MNAGMENEPCNDAEESWTTRERGALSSHIEEGYRQAERGELIDGAQVQREIQAMKEAWLQERGPARRDH
jgi:hypothetical protein